MHGSRSPAPATRTANRCRNGRQFRVPERTTMVFDVKSRTVNDFRGDERQLLASLPLYRVLR